MEPNPVLLFVEDEPDLREALVEYFEASGFTVLPAGTAEAAFRAAEGQDPDAVLTDLSLPDLKGDGFLEQFHVKHPNCRLFVHSGDSLFVPSPALVAMGLPPTSVFYKPADLALMADRILAALR